MIDKFKPHDTTSIAAFLAAISGATEDVNELSARLTTLAAISRQAALQIADLFNAAHTMATSQALATRCQCKCEVPTKPPFTVSSPLEKTWKGFFVGAAAIGAAGLWSAAVKRLWAIITAPIVMKGLAATGRIVTSLRAVDFVSEAFVAVVDAVGELVLAVGALAAAMPAASVAAAVALIGGAAFLIWRSWTSVVRIIRKLASTISTEALTIIGDLASAMGLGLKSDSPDQLEPTGNATSRERTSVGGHSLASAMVAALASNGLPRALFALREAKPSQIWNGVQPRRLTFAGPVATVVLTAPLLVASTMANISSDKATAPGASASMVFNSTPTIVINGCQSDGIEYRIEEALRQHRELIFAQWSRELQRRQRTEF